MAYQLIYTSSPVSLVYGRTGFSTVARSAQMSEKLATAVEKCGIYDISSGVVYSHCILAMGSQNWHVLSRICDAGVDYTNRNNYLAHHLVIDENEISKLPNPAEILMNWDGWISSWNEQPKLLGNAENLDCIKTKMSIPAKTWESVFGDAGAASLLGESPATIVADVGDADLLLKLFSESLLLNTNALDAWKRTFTTCYFDSSLASNFNWKTYSKLDANVATVNLKDKTFAPIPPCRAADYARTGAMTNRERLNLKVDAPAPYAKKFNVTDTGNQNAKSSLSSSSSLIFGAIGLSILLVGGIFVGYSFLEDSPESSRELPQALPSMAITDDTGIGLAEVSPKGDLALAEIKKRVEAMSSAKVREEVKLCIDKCDFKQALEIWDLSSYAQNDQSYRMKILGDIGYKADSLMRYSENVFDSEMSNADEKRQAIENIKSVELALSLPDMPRLKQRTDRLNNLKKKVGR